jgi:hypothetical protein
MELVLSQKKEKKASKLNLIEDANFLSSVSITKSDLLDRQILYKKNYFERLQAKSLQKTSKFTNRIIFSNKLN